MSILGDKDFEKQLEETLKINDKLVLYLQYKMKYEELKQRIDKAIEYIKEHNCIATNKEYLPKEYEYCCSYELLEILGEKENE